jgi:hypothetical protein
VPPLPCMLVCSFLCTIRTRDRGCSAHPAFPAPSDCSEGPTDANLGRIAPRECGHIFRCHRPALTGRPSIPETPMIESRSRGVLDPPHARGMTESYGDAPSLPLPAKTNPDLGAPRECGFTSPRCSIFESESHRRMVGRARPRDRCIPAGTTTGRLAELREKTMDNGQHDRTAFRSPKPLTNGGFIG